MTQKRPHVVVESAAALHHAMAQLGTSVHWVTMSPYVTEILRERGDPVVVLDELLDREEANAVGYAALDAAKGAAAAIDAQTDWPLGVKPGAMLVRSLHRAITAFLYKAALMDRLRREIGADAALIAIGNPEPSPVTGFEVQCGRFDTLLATFTEAVGGTVMHFDAPKPSGSGTNGDFMRPSPWTRLVTVMNAPVASISYRVLRRLASKRPRRIWFGPADMVAAVLSSNELVEETTTALVRRGAGVLWLPDFPLDAPREQPVPDAELLEHRIGAEIAKPLRAQGRAGSAVGQVGPLVAARTIAALARVDDLTNQAERWCSALTTAGSSKPVAVLSNAVSSPADHMAVQRLMARGFRVYVFEHGTGPGLDMNHEAVYDAGLAPWVDGAVYYTENQRSSQERTRKNLDRSSLVAGAPAIARNIGFRPLQRWAIRRALELSNQKRVVAWVTGLYPNNVTFLPHYYRDGSYHALRRQIIYDVLGKVNDHVLLKLYPTFRHLDPDPVAGLMRLPHNCKAAHLVDFRNIRAAADVIVLDVPGSSLAWCWGAGVPIIYLDTEMTLTRMVASQFEKALFYIDAERGDWPETLAGLLKLPHEELCARWCQKAVAREAIGEQMIIGPSGSPGTRAAEWIMRERVYDGFRSSLPSHA